MPGGSSSREAPEAEPLSDGVFVNSGVDVITNVMWFTCSRTETVRVPLSEVLSAELEKDKVLRVRKSSFELIISSIQSSVKDYPRLTMSEGSLGDYYFHRLTAKRHQDGAVRTANFKDGLAVAFTTRSRLEDKAHYLVAPTHGVLEYGVTAINVDSQVIGSRKHIYYGADELSVDESAVSALHYCAGALAVESVTGWQHLLTERDLTRIRRPQILAHPE